MRNAALASAPVWARPGGVGAPGAALSLLEAFGRTPLLIIIAARRWQGEGQD